MLRSFQVKPVGGEGKQIQDGLQAPLMYEIQHQAATATNAPSFPFGHSGLRRGPFVVQGDQRRTVLVSRLKSSLIKDLQSCWQDEQRLRIVTGHDPDQDSAASVEEGFTEAVGACLLSVEILQRVVKQRGHVAMCQHWGRGCQTGSVAGVRRGGAALLSSAATAACIRVAALEFPERQWAAIEFNQNSNLVRPTSLTALCLFFCNI